jgi:transketolase
MELTSSSIKMWSRIGARPTYGMAMMELVKEREDLMVLTADMSTSAGLDRFRKAYPEKFVDVGIAEQNMIGIAAGLADNGYNVFTVTFAPFQSIRCCEQIRVDLAYADIKVTMTGLASGLVNGPLGNTHCCFEDIGILRSIPNLIILSPADGVGIAKAVFAAAECDKPVYIRLTGGANNPIVYNNDIDFKIGKAIELEEGDDLTIFATGTMVYNSLQAAKILREKGISTSVWDMHTIKPIDKVAIEGAVRKDKMIVTVEEHSVIGGLSSAVAECVSTFKNNPSQLAIGVDDFFPKPGDYQFMLKQCGLTAEQIAEKILETLKQ